MGKCHARVVGLLVDHVDLRPGGELHIVVRALQACAHNQLAGCIQAWERMASGEWQDAVAASASALRKAGECTERVVACPGLSCGIKCSPSSRKRARPDFLPTMLAISERCCLMCWMAVGKQQQQVARIRVPVSVFVCSRWYQRDGEMETDSRKRARRLGSQTNGQSRVGVS